MTLGYFLRLASIMVVIVRYLYTYKTKRILFLGLIKANMNFNSTSIMLLTFQDLMNKVFDKYLHKFNLVIFDHISYIIEHS